MKTEKEVFETAHGLLEDAMVELGIFDPEVEEVEETLHAIVEALHAIERMEKAWNEFSARVSGREVD